MMKAPKTNTLFDLKSYGGSDQAKPYRVLLDDAILPPGTDARLRAAVWPEIEKLVMTPAGGPTSDKVRRVIEKHLEQMIATGELVWMEASGHYIFQTARIKGEE